MTGSKIYQVNGVEDLATIGGRIASARARKGLSAAKLGALIGRTRAAVSLWEANKNVPPMSMIEAMSEVLEVQSSWLWNGVLYGPALQVPEGGSIPALDQIPTSISGSLRLGGYSKVDRMLEQMPEAFSGVFSFARLGADAPNFNLRQGDLLLLGDKNVPVQSDGKLYAVESTVGVVAVRSEPLLDSQAESGGEGRPLQITTGHGQSYRTAREDLDSLGKVNGWLHKEE
ncbi:helix-turn-helix domain-containing protein [Novosphingobium sp. FSY-8]|uniref:Helix-turn-helix domain-containing protein n=1 Tax=Novosphingobium ovatum TaxID=1908523 RepID=A0ABW9XGX9_9SPHN|nr:helix-turn-helix transcriptional regulator [Novosphingobium ovatum]NBC37813.1 helix-turn-helix domain-containing protein [Novosphingobium ovatum]